MKDFIITKIQTITKEDLELVIFLYVCLILQEIFVNRNLN